MKNIKYITLTCAAILLFIFAMSSQTYASSLTAYITTAGDTPQSSITLKAGDLNGSTSNVIFYAHVNADASPYKCYWDLGEGGGYDAGYACSFSALQQRQNAVFGVPNSSVVLNSTENNYTKVGDYTVRFKVTDTAGVTVEATPLLVHVTNDVRPAKISVITPSAGQALKAGQSVLVQWNNDNVTTAKVNVSILDAENRRLGKTLFGGSIINDGNENWVVTPFTREDLFDYQTRQYVSGSGKYIIVVQCIGGSPCEQGESGQFTIMPTDTTPSPSNISQITVMSPNGGENWRLGSTQTIKWNGGQNPLEIMLETYSEGELVVSGWIATKVDPLTGQYTWKVGDIYNTDSSGKKFFTTATPAKYFIRVNDFKTGSLDRSDSLFTISPQPSIPTSQPVKNQNIQPTKSPVISNNPVPVEVNTNSNDTQVNSAISVEKQDAGMFGAIKNIWKRFLSIF